MVQVDNQSCLQKALCCLTCGILGKPSQEGATESTPFTKGMIEASEPPGSPNRSPYHPPSVDRPLTPTSEIGNEDTHQGGGDVSPLRDGLSTDQRV